MRAVLYVCSIPVAKSSLFLLLSTLPGTTVPYHYSMLSDQQLFLYRSTAY
jgi:hypothetical protein